MTPLEYVLNLVQEESAEIIQAASKCSRFGMLSKSPKTGIVNKDALILEINDLLSVLELLKEELEDQGIEFNGIGDPETKRLKIEKILKMAVYSIRCGALHSYHEDDSVH